MASGTVQNVRYGSGSLYVAAEGAAEPTSVGSANGFSDVIDTVVWSPVGYTEEGHTFKYETETDPIEVDEETAPIAYAVTGTKGTLEFAYAEMNALNLKRVLGGAVATTGSGATTVETFEPLAAGALPDRIAILWESADKKERWIYRACMPTDDSEIERKKGSKATIPATYSLLTPASGAKLFKRWYSKGA